MNKLLSMATCLSIAFFASQSIAQETARVPVTLNCFKDHNEHEKKLQERYNETLIFSGLGDSNRYVVKMYANIENQTTTIINVFADGSSCAVSSTTTIEFHEKPSEGILH